MDISFFQNCRDGKKYLVIAYSNNGKITTKELLIDSTNNSDSSEKLFGHLKVFGFNNLKCIEMIGKALISVNLS